MYGLLCLISLRRQSVSREEVRIFRTVLDQTGYNYAGQHKHRTKDRYTSMLRVRLEPRVLGFEPWKTVHISYRGDYVIGS
jgi:hypothetical protein